MTNTTIQTATDEQLCAFVADLTGIDAFGGWKHEDLVVAATNCERLSSQWYGEAVTFAGWAQ